jgi:flagellar motor protein MotB
MQGVQAGTAAQLANLQGPQLQQQLQQQQQQQQIQLMQQQQQAQLAAARQQQQQAAMQQFGMQQQQQQFVPGMPGMAAGGAMSQHMALPGGVQGLGVQQLPQGLAMPVRVSQQQ